MQYRSGKEIRELFIKFWVEKGSHHYRSFSLIPDDPSLLFTIAGMVPFKTYYLGMHAPEYPHAVTCQKCVRTNDIENVGRTARHHTFFEMLGNFAWGSYFKKEAITWAWEFLTQQIGLEPERLYASIYKDDEEAYGAWHQLVGLPDNKIKRFGEDENYWFMGERGPCGPCSEIYYDRGPKYGCGKPTCGVGCDCDRYMEIWNLVFTQFDRQQDGSMVPLPRKNIDTGMGLERLTSIVQGVDTDYETDLFMPLIDYTCKKAGVRYGEDARNDMAVRVISDHVRSVAFMLADGVLPSNDGPGYVLRRLLRRAARYGRLLGFEGSFICEYMPILIDKMGDPYSELSENRLTIEQIIGGEESRFEKTLMQGTELFESEAARLQKAGQSVLSGEVAFQLYDTYGFPPELTLEMASEKGLTVDDAGFKKAMEDQRQRARASSKQKKSSMHGDVYSDLENAQGATEFIGYQTPCAESKVIALLTDEGAVERVTGPAEFELVLNTTPFYAERGGEVGDTGFIKDGDAVITVDNVTAHGGIYAHSARLKSGSVAVGDVVSSEVNSERLNAIRRNHTATHLLHEALGRVLGGHVRQAGSLVTDKFLRFDFTHQEAMSEEQINEVERLVNMQVLANTPLEVSECGREEAKAQGAKALFDEKYGDVVRVVRVPGFSTELCGGMHVRATGDIGLFKIIREESVGSGIRRILALTGMNSLELSQHTAHMLGKIIEIFATDEASLLEKAQGIIGSLKYFQRKAQEAELKGITDNLDQTFERSEAGGLTIQRGRFSKATPDMLREIGDKVKAKCSPTVVVMSSMADGENCQLMVMADEKAVKMGVHAGNLVKAALAVMGGRGGGRPNMAQGGAPHDKADKLDEAFAKVMELLGSQLKG